MLRKCIGCGELKLSEDMIKITKRFQDGCVFVNPDSKTFGRSAYLCYNQSCIDKAFKKSGVKKALRSNTDIDKTVLLNLIN